MSLSALDLALLASKCKHPAIKLVSTTAEFECDCCGLQATSTFLMFREQALSCEDCGLLVHEKCLHEPLSPVSKLYAFTRRRERKANLIWKTALLPELKAKHAALEQKAKTIQENLKRLRQRVDEAHWNRSWAIRTFAAKFYGEFNPEKAEPGNLNQLVVYYAKTPARCRIFFERLASSYPEHKVRILVEAKNLEDVYRKDEADLNELEMIESSAEHMNNLKDELQREISFPMNPAMGVSPKWRLRLNVDGTTVAMGDFFLDHVRARLRITAGVPENTENVCFVNVEIVGLEATKKAVFSASLSKFGMSGPALPVSYSADNLSLSFECAFKLRADYQHYPDNKKKGEWKVSAEGTSCVISNLRHAVEGSSIPIPSKVIDFALDSLLTYGLKKSVLAVLPSELGEYILKFRKRVCDIEWRIKLESLISKDNLKKTPLHQVTIPERHLGPKWRKEGPGQLLTRVMKKLTPRAKNADEVWTLSKVMDLYRRYMRESIEREQWLEAWNAAIGRRETAASPSEGSVEDDSPITADDVFAFIEKLDSKPCSIEVECVTCNVFVAVRDLSRVVRGVLLRAVSSKSTTSVELREGTMLSRKQSAPYQQQQENTKATAQQARAAIYEVCSSFEQAVESALSHAVRSLRFGLEIVIAGGLLSFNVSRMKVISKLGEEFEAPIPAKWIGDKLLQSGNAGYPWKNTFSVDANSGALKFVFIRNAEDPPEEVPAGVPLPPLNGEESTEKVTTNGPPLPSVAISVNENHRVRFARSFGDLIVQLAELEVRIAFDGLVEELLRQQRKNLFGRVDSESTLFAGMEDQTKGNLSPGREMPPTLRDAIGKTEGSLSTLLTPESSTVAASPVVSRAESQVKSPSLLGTTNGTSEETFIMMRLGFKGNVGAVARGLGNPRIETSVQHVLLNGPFDSLIRLFREFRLGKSADETKRNVDEVDALLEKLESKTRIAGPDQKLLTSVLMDMDANATVDSDLHLNVSLPENDPRPAFVFVDDVDLVTFVSEIIQIVT